VLISATGLRFDRLQTAALPPKPANLRYFYHLFLSNKYYYFIFSNLDVSLSEVKTFPPA